MVPSTPQDHSSDEPQVLSLDNICMIDGSWTSASQFSGCIWAWMDNLEKIQLMGIWNYIRRKSPLHSEVEALRWTMESMLQYWTCQRFGTDCKDLIDMIKEPHAWPSFTTKLKNWRGYKLYGYVSRISGLLIFHERKIKFQTL